MDLHRAATGALNFSRQETPHDPWLGAEMIATYRALTLDITITESASGKIFIGDLIGRRGKPLAGYVCGRVDADGQLLGVRHVTGSAVRSL